MEEKGFKQKESSYVKMMKFKAGESHECRDFVKRRFRWFIFLVDDFNRIHKVLGLCNTLELSQKIYQKHDVSQNSILFPEKNTIYTLKKEEKNKKIYVETKFYVTIWLSKTTALHVDSVVPYGFIEKHVPTDLLDLHSKKEYWFESGIAEAKFEQNNFKRLARKFFQDFLLEDFIPLLKEETLHIAVIRDSVVLDPPDVEKIRVYRFKTQNAAIRFYETLKQYCAENNQNHILWWGVGGKDMIKFYLTRLRLKYPHVSSKCFNASIIK